MFRKTVSLLTVAVLCLGTVCCRAESVPAQTSGTTGQETAQTAKPATLTFSSFDGGGPEYYIEIEDPEIVTYTGKKEYDDPDHEMMTGAGYTETYTFTGLKPGTTKMTISMYSPLMESMDAFYTVFVDENLNVTLSQEKKITGFSLYRYGEMAYNNYQIITFMDKYSVSINGDEYEYIDESYVDALFQVIEDYNLYEWDGFDDYNDGVLDGEGFRLDVTFTDGTSIWASGDNAFPDHYFSAVGEMQEILDGIQVSSGDDRTESPIEENQPETAPGENPAASAELHLKTGVTKENRSEYDFTEKAIEYLTTIGEKYPDRRGAEAGDDSLAATSSPEDFLSWLTGELTDCGYDPAQIEEQRFSGESMFGDPVKGCNIILTIPGQRPEQIIAGAHFDGTGLGDNGSGTALLLAAAVSLVDATPRYTLKFIFFDKEEELKVGSRYYAGQMSDEEIASTVYMINCDALAFGDFCNIYGGTYGDIYDIDFIEFDDEAKEPEVKQTEGYDFAADIAEQLGFQVYRTEDLEGYYEENGGGMEPREDAFFTNPWTFAHPAPLNKEILPPSPATIGASDHAPFAEKGILYIYFEASNWWAEGTDETTAFMAYNETYDESLGDGGKFMNTDQDTLENLNSLFPGRAEQHFRMYSPLLSALLLVEPK